MLPSDVALPSDLDAEARTAAARQLFDELGDKGSVDLVVLAGMDLCVLGGPRHSMCWEPLARLWLNQSTADRDLLTRARTTSLVERGLLIADPAAPDGEYALDPRLGIALVARAHPVFAITVGHTPASPPLSLFAIGDEQVPVRGIVVEAPGRYPAKADEAAAGSPLTVVFSYLLVTPENAAEFLARWAIRPVPASHPFGVHPPRNVSLFCPPGRPGPAGVKLAVRGDGTMASVQSPDGSAAEFAGEHDIAGLAGIGRELISRGTP